MHQVLREVTPTRAIALRLAMLRQKWLALALFVEKTSADPITPRPPRAEP